MTSSPNSLTPARQSAAPRLAARLDANAIAPSSRLRETSLKILQAIFSFPAMLGTLLVGGVFLAARQFNVDPDIWWHIRVGEIVLRTHHLPTGDPFSFTVPGQPWMAAEWLGDTLISTVARIGGMRGLDALLLILGAAVIVSLCFLATLRSGNSKAGVVAAAVLLPFATLSFNLRPQMLGFLFLVLTLIALELFKSGKHAAVWFLPPLFFIWVNTHGSFPIGLGTIFVYWMSGLVRFRFGQLEARPWSKTERLQISGVFLACLSALMLTPYGSRLAAYPFEVAFKLPLGVANVQEWRTMPFNEAAGKLFLVLILGFILVQLALDLVWRIEEIALFLFGTAMACMHVRFLLIFVPFFAPVLGVIVARWIRPYDKKKDQFLLNAALMALVIFGVVHYFPQPAELQERIAEKFPVKAVEYIQSHDTPGPMFNAYGFGGYLIWSRWPEHKVFIDGRADPYERGGVFADYIYVRQAQPGTLAVLRGYSIRSCLLERNEPMASLLASSPDWQRVYADDLTVLFVRRDAAETRTSSEATPDRPSATALAVTKPLETF